MFEELGSTEVIDKATQQDAAMRIVTAGHAVTAMGRNGLGFLNHQLYLVPQFFQHKPLARLMAPGMQASHRHDAPRGRALDTLYAFGVTELYSRMAATAATRLGLTRMFSHRDTTRVHGEGRSHSAQPPDAQVVHIPRGSRRAHRPDLHQVMVAVVVEPPAGLPVRRPPLRGQSHEGKACGQVVSDPMAPLHTPANPTSLVADRALSSAAPLPKLAETSRTWLTRVPATLPEAQAVLAQANPQTRAPLPEG
jgi:transposase